MYSTNLFAVSWYRFFYFYSWTFFFFFFHFSYLYFLILNLPILIYLKFNFLNELQERICNLKKVWILKKGYDQLQETVNFILPLKLSLSTENVKTKQEICQKIQIYTRRLITNYPLPKESVTYYKQHRCLKQFKLD